MDAAAPGLIGPDGQPLRSGGTAERRIITNVRKISDTLLREVTNDPRIVFNMPPRRFEELVAELLKRSGGAVRWLVGIEVGVVSGVLNLESPGVGALGWRLRHEEAYHAA